MTHEKWDAGFLFVFVGIGALVLGFVFGAKVGAYDQGRATAGAEARLRAWQEEAVERGHMEVWNRGSLRNAHYWWKEDKDAE